MATRKRVLLTLQVLSMLCAVAAAFLCWMAANDSTPERVRAAMKAHGGMDIFGSDLSELVEGLAWQGTMNVYAAVAALGAALSQGIVIAVSLSHEAKRAWRGCETLIQMAIRRW
jgi:hypothetical protein